MFKELLDTLKSYKKITLFRHANPDGDAIFSCLGFKQFINDNFPDKEIHICGNDTYDINPYHEDVEDDFIKGSLGIVLDTANLERIDDGRINLCDKTVKIDHHPPLSNYGDLNIVSKESAACSELLTEIFCSDEFNEYEVSLKTREYLYCGILTDSMSFTTSSTTAKTLKLAGKLVGDDINVSLLNDYVFKVKLNEFEKITKLRTYLKVNNRFGYLLLDENDLKDLDMSSSDAKNNVAEFKNVEEFNIWGVIAQNEQTHLYDVSLRSRLGHQVNETAIRFGGGGHVNASGIKNLTYEQVKELVLEISTNSIK